MTIEHTPVYALYIDLEDCVDYRFDAYDSMDLWDDFLDRNFKGYPLPEHWQLPKHTVGHRTSRLNDFVQGYTQAPFVSERVVQVLTPILRREAEFRGIGKILGEPYFVMNVVNIVDCLDENRSCIVRAADGRVLTLRQAVFNQSRFPHAAVFKVPQDTGRIYVAECFVNVVTEHRLTGVGFECSENIGIGVINKAFSHLPLGSESPLQRKRGVP